MNNNSKILHQVCLTFIPLILIFLIACSESAYNNQVSQNEGIALPGFLTRSSLPPGEIRAELFVNDSLQDTKLISDNEQQSVSFTLNDISKGTHSFRIDFSFKQEGTLKYVYLARSTNKNYSISGGENVLNFADEEYSKPDNNLDGKPNLEHIIDGTNPNACVLGASKLGECELG